MNIALKFIEEGAKVIINSRKIKDLQRLAKKNRNFDFILEMFQIQRCKKNN